MEDDFLLAEISKLYYIDQMKQKEIADLFSMTPIQVSRMLRTAVEKQLVRFHVNMPVSLDYETAKVLKQRYGLRECVVVSEESEANVPVRIAQYVSRFVFSLLKEDSILGLSWGRRIYETAKLFPYSKLKKMKIVQLAGGVSSDENHLVTPSKIIISASERLGGVPVLLNAPFFTTNHDTREQLMLDHGIQRVFALAAKSTANIIGASPLRSDNTMSKVGIISKDDIRELAKSGAVGDVAGFFINSAGEPVNWSKAGLYTGVPLSVIKEAGLIICVAHEPEKEAILRASLRGQYYDMLVVGQKLAELLLA